MVQFDAQFVEARLGCRLANREFWSYALFNQGTNGKPPPVHRSQQILALIGDKVIDLGVAEFFVDRYPKDYEKFSLWRSRTAKNETFAMVLQDSGIIDVLRAERRVAPTHPHKLGTIFEALIGAAFVDRGYPASADILGRVFFPRIPGLIESIWWDNPQLRLGTVCQQVLHAQVHYTNLGQIRTPRGPVVVVEVSVSIPRRPRLVVQGEGSTKNEAKRAAALEALRKLGMITDSEGGQG